jgi:small subunit ribosomal protein S8
MSMDVVADFCTSLRNGVAVKKRVVDVPHSGFKECIAAVMKEEGYLKDYQVIALDSTKKLLRVFPRYVTGRAAITEIKSISTCGSRVYCRASELWPLKNGFGIRILSTSKGVMSDRKAKAFVGDGKRIPLGGEVICTLW